ncbi:MAG: 50S ribosomal protein L25 [Planctomycetota bacterium]
MKSVKIEVEERTKTGTNASRGLRKQGKLPVNLYGLGRSVRALAVNAHQMTRLMDQGQHVVELTLSGEVQAALVTDLQFDAIGSTILHADLIRVDRDTPVHTNVVIRYIGTAPAVAGSIVEKMMDSIPLEILPLEIPHEFVINLGSLAVDAKLTLGDIELPAGGKIFGAEADAVVVINHIRHEKEEVPADEEGEGGSVEPEVIGKAKEPEGEE